MRNKIKIGVLYFVIILYCIILAQCAYNAYNDMTEHVTTNIAPKIYEDVRNINYDN